MEGEGLMRGEGDRGAEKESWWLKEEREGGGAYVRMGAGGLKEGFEG